MPHVIIRTYSHFHDVTTRTEFAPLRVGPVFVGHVAVDEETAARFAARPAFEVLDDETFAALSHPPADAVDVRTGDVLSDQAQAKSDQVDAKIEGIKEAENSKEAEVTKAKPAAAPPPPPPPSS